MGLDQPQGSVLAVIQYLEADFCVAALEDALALYGKPEIFNTDQGSQFTSDDFSGALKDAGIRISMMGKDAGWTMS